MSIGARLSRRHAAALALVALGCGGEDPSVFDGSKPEEVVVPLPYARPEYATLAETGLFSSSLADRLAPGIEPFEPNFKLWSDGAEKRRFVALPPNTRIDTTDMDHWQFPIGTRFWKEFWLGGARLETRMIERYGDGPDDFWMGAFVWNADQSDAIFSDAGQADVAGTLHDVPSSSDCHTCHDGEAGRVLGFSALELADQGSTPKPGVRLDDLVAHDRLTAPPPPKTQYSIPGDETTRAAFGYLHANCGHCHNPTGYCAYAGMTLRLGVNDTVPEDTLLWRTAVGIAARLGDVPAAYRVAPGAPNESAIVQRMRTRGNGKMPFLATDLVDDAGVTAVSAWIAGLPH